LHSKENQRCAFYHKVITAPDREARQGAMRRKLVWIDEQHFSGWGCSECAWVFSPVGFPTSKSLDEMKMNFERRRDKDFSDHVRAEHSRAQNKTR